MSPPVAKPCVEQVVADQFGALYAVHNADQTIVFELIVRNAA
jgi:hypothetical protein